jgi:hypothetical protein
MLHYGTVDRIAVVNFSLSSPALTRPKSVRKSLLSNGRASNRPFLFKLGGYHIRFFFTILNSYIIIITEIREVTMMNVTVYSFFKQTNGYTYVKNNKTIHISVEVFECFKRQYAQMGWQIIDFTFATSFVQDDTPIDIFLKQLHK